MPMYTFVTRERPMKRARGVSSISRFLQRNPAWSQVVCVVGVALLIILGPILLYGLLFQSGPDSVRMLSNVPWWPVVLLVALVALLSLLHGTSGVSVQKRSDKQQGAGAGAETSDHPDRPAPQDHPDRPDPLDHPDREDLTGSTDPTSSTDPASSRSSEPPEPPEPSEPPAPSKPPAPPAQPGPSGQNGDPLRCTMQERSLNGMSRVETKP